MLPQGHQIKSQKTLMGCEGDGWKEIVINWIINLTGTFCCLLATINIVPIRSDISHNIASICRHIVISHWPTAAPWPVCNTIWISPTMHCKVSQVSCPGSAETSLASVSCLEWYNSQLLGTDITVSITEVEAQAAPAMLRNNIYIQLLVAGPVILT